MVVPQPTLRFKYLSVYEMVNVKVRRHVSIWGLIIFLAPKMTLGNFSHLVVKVIFCGGFPMVNPCKGPFVQLPYVQALKTSDVDHGQLDSHVIIV